MKALRLGADGPRLVASVAEPKLAEGEALVRPALVGLGALDVVAMGLVSSGAEFTPGREFVGVIESAPASAGLATGQRVVGSVEIYCGVCDMCRSGLSSHCRDRVTLGSPDRDGCLAERFAIPAANLIAIHAGLPDEAAVFALPLARAAHTAGLLHVEGRPYITVLGRGAEAILAAQVLARLNASVRLVAECPATLAACDRLGVKHRAQRDVGRRADQDVVVACVGSDCELETAMRMVRPRGKIVVQREAPMDERGVDLTLIVENEIELLGSRGARFAEALATLAERDVTVEGLISRRVTFDRAAEALQTAADPDQIKVVVEM